jgi:hypothetical protein
MEDTGTLISFSLFILGLIHLRFLVGFAFRAISTSQWQTFYNASDEHPGVKEIL